MNFSVGSIVHAASFTYREKIVAKGKYVVVMFRHADKREIDQ
jgi:hypothetical protein